MVYNGPIHQSSGYFQPDSYRTISEIGKKGRNIFIENDMCLFPKNYAAGVIQITI